MSRRIRSETISQVERVLADTEEAVEGEVACIDESAGTLVPAQTGAAFVDLVPLGYFMQTLTGDGVKKVKVRLFREVRVEYLQNDDAPNAVEDGDFLKACYLVDGRTVSMDTATDTRSIAGRVWGVEGARVAVEMAKTTAEYA